MHLHLNGPQSIFKQVEVIIGSIAEPDVSYGSSVTTVVRMNVVKFGDGYEQRSLDGINAQPLRIRANWNNRTLKTIREIEKFFKGDKVFYARTPEEYFYFIPPEPFEGETIQTPRKFTCKEWTVTANTSNNYSLSAELEEVFDP